MTIMSTGLPLITTDWRHLAACKGHGDVFLPRDEKYTNEDKARRICGACPVLDECLQSAMAEEDHADQYRRAGIRGGLNPLERARRAGCAQQTPSSDRDTVEDQKNFAELERVLREGELSDTAAAKALGMPRSTVSAFRRELGLPSIHERVTPQSAFAKHTRSVAGGHVEWGSAGIRRQIGVQGRCYDVRQLAFLVGHGREAVGHVKSSCEHPNCVAWQHLTDRQIREAGRGRK